MLCIFPIHFFVSFSRANGCQDHLRNGPNSVGCLKELKCSLTHVGACVFTCIWVEGDSLESVLTTLKNRHRSLLHAVLKKYQEYSACTGLLDTGYFKRLDGRVSLWNPKTLFQRGAFRNIDTSDFQRWMKALRIIQR